MKIERYWALVITLCGLVVGQTIAQADASAAADGANPPAAAPANFDAAAVKALTAMSGRARELGVHGVAVVALARGGGVQSWDSKMIVIGNLATGPGGSDKGSNLLGIAYAKAAEMAATLKDSGKGGRPPLTGEFGWQGGVVAQGRAGIMIVAFSGGASDDDVRISQAGLAVLKNEL